MLKAVHEKCDSLALYISPAHNDLLDLISCKQEVKIRTKQQNVKTIELG